LSQIKQYEDEPIVIIEDVCSMTTDYVIERMVQARQIGRTIGQPYIVILDA